MTSHVVIVAGPARSGKTGNLLSYYRATLRKDLRRGELAAQCLWLTPTGRAESELRARLVEDAVATSGAESRVKAGALLRPNVMTFEGFAQAILDAAPQITRPLSGMARRQLIRRLIDERAAKGELRHFAAIADTPGFVDLVGGFLREMKRHEIWPDAFEEACQARGLTAKDAELAALYRDYQAVLDRCRLYDAEGRFWSARSLVEQGEFKPFDQLRLVVADGFTDFTWTQLEILKALAGHSDELFVSLPLERDTQRRADLFGKPRGALAQIQERLPHAEIRWLDRGADAVAAADWPAMRHLEERFLTNPRAKLPACDARGVEIIAAAQQIGELRAIAARVKRLLLDGDGSDGGDAKPVRPSDVAVVFRSTAEIAPLVREVFADYGIPLAIDQRPKLLDSPLVKSVVALLKLDVEDWPFRGVLSALGNNYVAPPEFAERMLAVQAAAEATVREFQLPSGRDKLLERWRRLAAKDEQPAATSSTVGGSTNAVASAQPSTADHDRRAERRRAAAESLYYVEAVAAALAELPRQATPGGWAIAIESLTRKLGMLTIAAADDASNDRRAIERFLSVLRTGSRLSEWLGEETMQFTRDELLAHVEELIAEEEIPAPRDEVGRVRVLSAPAARTLSIPYLFLAGLAEHNFPRRAGEEVLYHEADRRRLIESGLRLPRRAERTSEEMLLFYEVATRATRRLVLSYPALNDKAEPLLASPFLLEIERLFPGGAIEKANAADMRPIPTETAGYSLADQRLLAMHEALSGDERRLANLVRTTNMPAAANLVRSLGTNDARLRPTFGAMEGMLQGEAAAKYLAAWCGAERVWSASQFEAYAACPMRYFFHYILDLREPADLELAADQRQRGSLLHAALAKAHAAVNAARGGYCSPVEADDEFRRGYLQQLDALAEQARRDTLLDAALVEIDRQLLASLDAVYVEQHRTYDEKHAGRLRPAHFEVSFGMSIGEGELNEGAVEVDVLSTATPLVLRKDGEEIRIGGRIDRIDLVAAEATRETTQFAIVDYKTGGSRGKKRAREEAADGRRVQLDLYALAVEEVVLAEREVVALYSGYWHVLDSGFVPWQTMHELGESGWQTTAEWSARKDELIDRVFALSRGIRAGEFPPASPDKDCTARCEFRTICRVAQARSLEKPWRPPDGATSAGATAATVVEEAAP